MPDFVFIYNILLYNNFKHCIYWHVYIVESWGKQISSALQISSLHGSAFTQGC